MNITNERIRDAAISHQVDLAHYSNSVVRRIIAALNRVDADLIAQLTKAIDKLEAEGATTLTVDRLESLLASVRSLNTEAYNTFNMELPAELRNLTNYEAGYQLQLFKHVIPIDLIIASVNAEQVYAAAMARPFQGRLLTEWSRNLEEGRMVRVRDAIRMGIVENQTNSQIVSRIRGTRAQGYTDGVLEIDRRNAEAVVRTAVQHVAGTVRDRFYDANIDLIKAVVWASTLDSRTTPECQVRDGLKYSPETHKPIGHSVPWLAGPGRLHWNCRSTSVPVLKSFRDLGIPIDEIAASTRASMDGQVPAETTYGEWLKQQSAARQDEILGPTRGKLLRSGGMDFSQFFNNKGVYLDLTELQARDAAAFVRAGV